jgi:hypothetical protein
MSVADVNAPMHSEDEKRLAELGYK